MIYDIENYLCDLCDSVFNDGIICDKVYNIEQPSNRAVSVISVNALSGDQNSVKKMYAKFSENRETRALCVQDAEKILNNFTKIGYKVSDTLAIYTDIQYITMPIKIVVGTKTVYTLSATISINVK
jgi:hypothetical protein